MEKYQNKFRIPSARLKGFDYGSHGLYSVTICTKNKEHYFGEIIETDNYSSLRGTEIGKVATAFWQQIPSHFPFVELDEFIIMPNHMHGILFFNKPEKLDWQPNKFGPQSQNLGSVLRGFKSSLKKHATRNEIPFEWQSRYYDRIIRDAKELEGIRNYIMSNPTNWKNDEFHPQKPL